MEEDKIKDLFSRFEPELSSDFQFMTKLRRNMEAVEMIRHRHEAMRRRNKKAVIIAAVTGCMVGMLLSLLLPYIGSFVAHLHISIPEIPIGSVIIDYTAIMWCVIGCASVLTAVNAYEIAMAKIRID